MELRPQTALRKIRIFGLGAVGSNLLVQLVKQYPDMEYEGIDFDRVEDRNIGTQAYFLEHVRQLKVKAVQVVAQRFVRKVKYRAVGEKITAPIASPEGGELYVDCFDNAASRALFPSGDLNILHLGFSPYFSAECLWNRDYAVSGDVDPNGPDICELRDAVSFIHGFVNTAICKSIGPFISGGDKNSFLVTNKTRIKEL